MKLLAWADTSSMETRDMTLDSPLPMYQWVGFCCMNNRHSSKDVPHFFQANCTAQGSHSPYTLLPALFCKLVDDEVSCDRREREFMRLWLLMHVATSVSVAEAILFMLFVTVSARFAPSLLVSQILSIVDPLIRGHTISYKDWVLASL